MNQTVTAQDIQKLPIFDTFDRTDFFMINNWKEILGFEGYQVLSEGEINT